jgi:ribosomal protein S6
METTLKKYEVLLIYPNTLKEDVLEKNVERARGEITKLGGVVAETQPLGSRTFARPLKKKDSGHYVRVMFTMDPANINPLQGRLKLIEDIFRVQVLCADARKKKEAEPKKKEEAAV